jgi:hypothetical protein
MDPRPLLPFEIIDQWLSYCPETGDIRWKVGGKRMKAGAVAGAAIGVKGYKSITIRNRRLYAHRIAWLLFHGYEPVGFLDHVNRDRSDNRIANLRVVSRKENGWNRKTPFDNTSGFKGVNWNKLNAKWQGRINNKHLGYFKNKEDAIACVRAARELAHGAFACHG